ncbi:unnamed protein product [Pieris macdunnoughi]|uniref:Uncharacterized protein n=1 Tax=Pieris macdunnoughi TaxID=345717 RepID=A0A821XX30_9NEOP|nr:unnamed protein product [Pieris macdunnoughi]
MKKLNTAPSTWHQFDKTEVQRHLGQDRTCFTRQTPKLQYRRVTKVEEHDLVASPRDPYPSGLISKRSASKAAVDQCAFLQLDAARTLKGESKFVTTAVKLCELVKKTEAQSRKGNEKKKHKGSRKRK